MTSYGPTIPQEIKLVFVTQIHCDYNRYTYLKQTLVLFELPVKILVSKIFSYFRILGNFI